MPEPPAIHPRRRSSCGGSAPKRPTRRRIRRATAWAGSPPPERLEGMGEPRQRAHRPTAWGEAIEALNNAVRLNPSEASLRWSLAAALAAADRHEEALAAIDAFDRLGGQRQCPGPRSLPARAASLEEVEDAYREGRGCPGSVDAFRELGLFLERANRLDRLSELLEQASAAGIAEESLAQLYVVRTLREGRAERPMIIHSLGPAEDPVGGRRSPRSPSGWARPTKRSPPPRK